MPTQPKRNRISSKNGVFRSRDQKLTIEVSADPTLKTQNAKEQHCEDLEDKTRNCQVCAEFWIGAIANCVGLQG